MKNDKTIWANPRNFLTQVRPDEPVGFFCPAQLARTVRTFQAGFPGQLTYAVKANPDEAVLANLAALGVLAFDVASPWEIDRVRSVVPMAALHYNNPVRTPDEIEHARQAGVVSYSVDCAAEFHKIADRVEPAGVEVAVRFRLPVKGAAYDFGAKFGADPQDAVALLKQVAARGFVPSLCFHPGTQCHDGAVWDAYIHAAGDVARRAGVSVARLNVGGGFPSFRLADERPDLDRIFTRIAAAAGAAFPDVAPNLLCEPGRGLVGDAFALGTRIKAIRPDGSVFLNDGIYGGFAENPAVGPVNRIAVFSPGGEVRTGSLCARTIFGPTCDSLDKLPQRLDLPKDISEGDFVLFQGLGAYSGSLATQFNGFGVNRVETVEQFAP